MPSRQTEPLFVGFCVTAASALDSICLLSLHERLRRTKEKRGTAKATETGVLSRHCSYGSMHGVLEGVNATSRTHHSWEKSGRLLVSSFGCKDTRLEKGWKGHMSLDGYLTLA